MRAAHLVRVAELAYGRRDAGTLEHAGRELAGLPIEQAQNAGLYYCAIAAKWHGRISEARMILEIVRGPYQARALHALGAIEHALGRFDEAASFYAEAINANTGCDAFAIISTQFQFSAIKSLNGDHGKALNDLFSLWPVVKVAAKLHPHLWPTIHNEIAFELLQLGKIKEARQAAAIAVASPIARQYPEWQETAAEAEAATSQTILIVVPSRPAEQRPQQKVIIHFQIVRPYVRRKLIKPTIGRAPVIRSIVERVATVAPIHAPPFNQ
jgi:tetratricopeptide (TPR) repeat protein